MSNSLRPHGLQHTRRPCPSPTPRACSSSCPFSRWYQPTISSSVIPFFSCLQSFPASGSRPLESPRRREGWGMVPGWTEEMTASEAAGKEAWEQARRPRPLKSQSAPKRRHHPEGNRSTDWSVFMMGSWVIFFQLLYAFFYFKNSCNACDLFSWSEAEKEKEKRKKQKQIPEEYQAF